MVLGSRLKFNSRTDKIVDGLIIFSAFFDPQNCLWGFRRASFIFEIAARLLRPYAAASEYHI